jgi:hypothetical protein
MFRNSVDVFCLGTAAGGTCRSGGSLLEDVHISGCNGSAIRIALDATGAYSSPAILQGVTLTANTGTSGAAVLVEDAASVQLDGCRISGNKGADSIIKAGQLSSVTITNCFLTDNVGTAVAFSGENMAIEQSQFVNNSVTGKGSGGAVRVQPDPGTAVLRSNAVIKINNTAFVDCSAGLLGGSVYLGPYTTLTLLNSNFSKSQADEGGAVLADRDACLLEMTRVNFTANRATKR